MRAFLNGAATILVAAALAGCAERSATTAKTGVAWLDRDNTPVNVKLTFDSTSVASATIGEEGGVVSTSTSDGTFFELEIPKGALHRREKITMIPVSRVDGLPLEKGGAVASVQLEPEGLRFDKPVKLTIEPAKPVPVQEQVGFAWTVQGTDAHLYPALGDSLAMEMQLLHFSGYGFGKAPPSDPGRIHLLYASAHAARLEAELAQVISKERANELLGRKTENSELYTTFRKVILEYYDGIIAPTMKIAETDDRMAECAFNFYLGWLRQMELMGMAPEGVGMIGDATPDKEALEKDPELVTRMSQASVSAEKIMDNVEAHVLERAQEGCRQHDLGAYNRVVALYRTFALLGITGKLEDKNFSGDAIDKATDQCYRWEVELSSSIDSRLPSGSSHFTLSSTAKYAPTDGKQEAPLNYVSLEISGRPWKDVMDAMSGGHGAELLQKRDGNFLRIMDFTVSRRGSRHGTVTVEKVDWKVVERDTVGTSCAGRDENQKADVADSLEVTLRIDPPTEIVHFTSDAVPAFDDEMHEWMRFFMQFRKAAGHEPTFAPDANPEDDSGAQPELVTVRLEKQSPGVWSADFRTPEGVTSEGLSETGHLILRHTPK